MTGMFTRRKLLKSALGLALAAPLIHACAPAAAPTAVPTAPAEKPAEKPAATEAATAVAAGQGKITLTYCTYADPRMDWERVYGKKWAEQNPNVDLVIDEVLYAEMPTKQMAMLATNTLWDVSYSGVKWIRYPIYKGAFMPIDDLVSKNNYDLSDFLQVTITNSSFEGKLYGLPYIVEAGNLGLVFLNLDMLAEKGITPPTDDWSLQDFVDIAVKCTDPAKKIYGTDLLPYGFYDCALLARTWGGELMAEEGKKYLFNVDPKCIESIKWVVDLRAKHKCGPNRSETQGIQFAAGNMAMTSSNTSFVKPVFTTVGDKFKHDVVMFPKGPTGLRGYDSWTETFSIAASCKNPDEAFGLLTYITSREAGMSSCFDYESPPAPRISIWQDPKVLNEWPIYGRVLKLLTSVDGPFPFPWNFRYQECQDTWANNSLALFFGEVPFEEGMQTVQDAMQEILDLPRP